MSIDGRSVRAKSIYDEAHKKLVNSAIELFNDPDVPNENINISLIAKNAGTSVATAYNHFPNNLIDVFGSIFNRVGPGVWHFLPKTLNQALHQRLQSRHGSHPLSHR